ncbi:methionyl-tRNA formyltransferase [Sporolactobacillus spathodeae]|uniref:Methionyl-tRNA formyltransferase n=1 Tax=Sporolactobacillus spathodeae TaxID=1465502 RepID=A0ABS2QAQ7_9BACL|nr:methionyl-tRNA formyltransferase [Sporolactobacillus spathodeae]MBM7658254.1 methionyl-tRNA formyltransferase [Sporolactobacillus spathodeae]
MKIVFMGTPDFAVPILENLISEPSYTVVCVVTQPDRPKGRRHVLTAPPVKESALRHHIPVLQPEKVRRKDAVADILSYAPDLLITAAYGQILPQSLLDGPRLGCVNVHASLLPEYRGAAPIQQAIIDGKEETGVTIMYMVKQLDAGDMLAQVHVPINADETFGGLHDKLSAAGSQLLMETLPAIEAGSVHPVQQEESRVSFAPSIQHEDEAIVWSKSAKEIHNLVRGLNPFPGAYTSLDGKVFKIFSAQQTGLQTEEEPGKITAFDHAGILVATGSGEVLRITECQPAGKKRMRATDFLNGSGRTLQTGMQFGVNR